MLRGVRTLLWKDEGVELWQNSLIWQFDLFVLISYWEGAHVILQPMLNPTAGEHWRCVALLCSTLNRPFTSECSKTTLVLSLQKCVFSSIKAPAPGMNICPKYVGAFNRQVLRLSWLSVKSVITVALLQCLFSYCVHVMFRYSNFHNSFIGNNSILYINCVSAQNIDVLPWKSWTLWNCSSHLCL